MRKINKIVLSLTISIIILLGASKIVKADTSRLVVVKNETGRNVGYVDFSSNNITDTDTLGSALKKLGATTDGHLNVFGRIYQLIPNDQSSTDPTANSGSWLFGGTTNIDNSTQVSKFFSDNSTKINNNTIYLKGTDPKSSVLQNLDIKFNSTNDSVDFSNWTDITSQGLTKSANWNFFRNNRHYTIDMQTGRTNENNNGVSPLSTFTISDITDPNNIQRYTYLWKLGNGKSSSLVIYNAMSGQGINDNTSWNRTSWWSPAFIIGTKIYMKKSTYGNALAVVYPNIYSTDMHRSNNVKLSNKLGQMTEIVDVDQNGILQHYQTYSEANATRQNIEIGSARDTDLEIYNKGGTNLTSPGDKIAQYKGDGDSLYMKSDQSSKLNLVVTANIHYIDVSGKQTPANGWQPSDGNEITGQEQIITKPVSEVNTNGEALTWNFQPNYKLVGNSTEITNSATKFTFPDSQTKNDVTAANFRVYFAAKNQYSTSFGGLQNLRHPSTASDPTPINVNNGQYKTDDMVLKAGAVDSATISTESVAKIDKNMSYSVPFQEWAVSAGEITAKNARDYYVYVQRTGRTTLRAVPNFDFGMNSVRQDGIYQLANEVGNPYSSTLNLDYKDDFNPSSTTMPIWKFLQNSDNKPARFLVVTDGGGNNTDNWQVSAKMSNFVFADGTKVTNSAPARLTLNSTALTGINDYGTNSTPTWQKSVPPTQTTSPVLTAGSEVDTPILLGSDGNTSAIGSWGINYGAKDSASLNFPISILSNYSAKEPRLHATITWTLISKTP